MPGPEIWFTGENMAAISITSDRAVENEPGAKGTNFRLDQADKTKFDGRVGA
jgi:hypothetical protein